MEEAKHILILECPDFNLYDGFSFLETDQETLTLSAFRESIIKLGVKMIRCSMDRVFLFFKRYNLSGRDLLSFSEFVKCILPCDQELA